MKWFNDLKIRNKLFVGFGVVLVLAAFMGFIGYRELKKNDEDYTNLIDNVMSRSQSMTDIGWSFAKYRRILSSTILRVGDNSALERLKSQYEDEKISIKEQFKIFDDATAKDVTLSEVEKTEIRAISDRIENLINNEFQAIVDRVFDYAYNDNYEAAFQELNNSLEISNTLEGEISNFIQEAKNNTVEMSAASTKMARDSEKLLMIIPVLIIVLGIFIAVLISNIITRRINSVADAAIKISKGNFNVNVGSNNKDEIAVLSNSLFEVKTVVQKLTTEIGSIVDGASDGKLDVTIATNSYEGDWNKMAESINHLLESVIEPIKEVIESLEHLSTGNLDISVKGKYKGEFANMKTAMNDTLKMLQSYIKEISLVLGSMAEQNLTVSITREYVGTFSEIKTAINNIVSVFNKLLNEINYATEQVAAGSKQIAESSLNLAQGTTEQASSVQDLNLAIDDVSSQTISNAESTNQANKLAIEAKENAEKGNEEMSMMLKAMSDINESSANISKIIKVIEDISFQTNLLALNAAVEAARAGQHGKGFAVVAEEVRNLAGRSQRAAKETSELIEGSMQRASYGSKIADNTANALKLIVSEINEITDTIGEVAVSSRQQSDAIEQIKLGIDQISVVTQNNSATSEEQASSAEELSSQAELFKSMVEKFKL